MLGKPLKMPAHRLHRRAITHTTTVDHHRRGTGSLPALLRPLVSATSPRARPRAGCSRQLALCGLRSISNVVDITNYVMLEIGQPMHAFDMDTLESCQIIVRRAKDGEDDHHPGREELQADPQ